MKAFISYSWDTNNHKEWVRNFANVLRKYGVDTIIDQYDLQIGDDLHFFIENSVRSADFVFIICTPKYVEKANSRTGGVGEETILIAPFVYKNQCEKKIIPIVREKVKNSYPSPDYAKGRIYLDFCDDEEFSIRMEELLRFIYNKPVPLKPLLGAEPNFDHSNLSQHLSIEQEIKVNEKYKQLKEFLEIQPNDPQLLSIFGRVCLAEDKIDEASEAFNKILSLDPNYKSFDEIDSTVRSLAKKEQPFNMNKDSRIAMLHLGRINGSDDYVIDSAYGTDDPEILIFAGEHYLAKFDAEVDTAIAYFIKGTKNESSDSPWIKICDRIIQDFMRPERMVWYPYESYKIIEEIVQVWNEHKLKLKQV